MAALIISQLEKECLAKLKIYAESHPLNTDDLLDLINGGIPPGERDEFVCFIPNGFKVVYTVEPAKNGELTRHMSLSINLPGRAPNEHACQMVMEELGFKNKLVGGKCAVWLEQENVVNIVEYI